MKKKTFGIIVIILLLGIGGGILISNGGGKTKDRYQFAQITRGDLENTISSTGTISAVGTVEVGTQVSGTIANIYVDFNDKVRQGQLLAVLDTLLLKAAVLDAEANIERAQAQLEQALADYQRNLPLFEKGYLSEAEFLPFQIKVKTERASLKSAEVAWQRAQRNLKYAVIRSPIHGTVINRNVEEGQTVAASFATPTLFVIAEDLSRMEILAQVDESDIGQIKEGQSVRFDVQAYPERIFTGTVRQIRLQPTTIQNVVNYTVVVDVANDENLLLPGMTATVDFIVEQRKDVLLVPNAALRFQPAMEMIAEFRKSRQEPFQAPPDLIKKQREQQMRNRGQSGEVPGMDLFSPGQMPKDAGLIWYLDEGGNLAMQPLRTGVTDGKITEIVMSRGIKEGMQVITGLSQSGEEKAKSSRSDRRFGPPPPF